MIGLRALAVKVGADTRITDGGKEEAFGDLTRHPRVRLIYEPRPYGRLASSIELLRLASPGSPALAGDKRSPHRVPGYWVEVATFTDPDGTAALATRLLEHNLTVSIESAGVRGRQSVLRVRIGPFADEAAARAGQRIAGQRTLVALSREATP